MKTTPISTPTTIIAHARPALRKLGAVLLLACLGAAAARADIVYVSGCTSNCVSTTSCGSSPNYDLNADTGYYVYNDNDLSGFTSAVRLPFAS